MTSNVNFRQKIWLEGYNPIILLKGKLRDGNSYFAYVEMSLQEYEMLARNPTSFKGINRHGRIIRRGIGLPTEEDKLFIAENYNAHKKL